MISNLPCCYHPWQVNVLNLPCDGFMSLKCSMSNMWAHNPFGLCDM